MGTLTTWMGSAWSGLTMQAATPAGEGGDVARLAWLYFVREDLIGRLVATLVLVVAVWLLRVYVVRRLREAEGLDADDRRRWMVNARNVALLLTLLGIVVVWAQQIQTLAASVVLIAAAIVIATKELILCLSGSVIRATSHSFDIGDRIEIAGLRGDVIDRTALTTRILEIGPGQTSHQHTGRAITLPNSLFVSAPLINETFTEDYVLYPFSVPISEDQDWKRAEAVLLRVATEECAPFIDKARAHMKAMLDHHGLEMPNVEPRISIQVPEAGKIVLLARIPAPARRKGRMEQSIIRRFLVEFHQPPAAAPPGEGI